MRPKVLCGSKCSTALQLPRRATTSTARGTHCTHSIMVMKATTGAAVDSGSIYCLAHILARDTTTWILHTVSTKRIARRRHAMGIFDYAFGRTTLVPYTPLPYYYGTPSRRPVAAASPTTTRCRADACWISPKCCFAKERLHAHY